MSRRRRGFFTGAAIGAMVAGAAALLFAPKAGKELREDIAKKAEELSKDLDKKIIEAKKDAEGLKGEVKKKKLRSIERAEELKMILEVRSKEFSKAGKRVTRVAAREVDKTIQNGKVLLAQLDEHKLAAMKDTKKFVKKAGSASGKVARSASKEIKKDSTKKKK